MTEKQAQEIIEYLRDIKMVLEGNTRLGIEGAIKKLERHDRWISSMNIRIAAWSSAGGAIVLTAQILWSFLKH